jgi:uncharacterized protein (DUF488 family)
VFLALLEGAGIRLLVDVRTSPGSRKHPQFGMNALAATLERRAIEYVWKGKELGGWRRPRPDSRHTGISSPGFRGYADHMESGEFGEARTWLMERAARSRTVVMCAESLWWKCHRRMIADAVVAVGGDVRHLMEGGRLDTHRLHPSARVERGGPVYDGVVEQAPLDLDKGSV